MKNIEELVRKLISQSKFEKAADIVFNTLVDCLAQAPNESEIIKKNQQQITEIKKRYKEIECMSNEEQIEFSKMSVYSILINIARQMDNSSYFNCQNFDYEKYL